MAAHLLDSEFMHYWSKLTVIQKESLLSVAKNFVHVEQEDISDHRAKLIEAEREAYLNGDGKNFTWQQVKEMALHKEKRNAL